MQSGTPNVVKEVLDKLSIRDLQLLCYYAGGMKITDNRDRNHLTAQLAVRLRRGES